MMQAMQSNNTITQCFRKDDKTIIIKLADRDMILSAEAYCCGSGWLLNSDWSSFEPNAPIFHSIVGKKYKTIHMGHMDVFNNIGTT